MNHPLFPEENINKNKIYRKDEIWLLHKRHYEKLQLADVSYIESDNGIIYITTEEKVFPFSASLNSFERQTKTPFIVRISRKHLVNINKAISFDLKDHQLAFKIFDKKKWLPIGPTFRESIYSYFPKLKTD